VKKAGLLKEWARAEAELAADASGR
jgi:hypothetical protein